MRSWKFLKDSWKKIFLVEIPGIPEVISWATVAKPLGEILDGIYNGIPSTNYAVISQISCINSWNRFWKTPGSNSWKYLEWISRRKSEKMEKLLKKIIESLLFKDIQIEILDRIVQKCSTKTLEHHLRSS